MSEYTPTTAQVRAVYADGESEGTPEDYAEFDRWLAAHDAEVRALAVNQCIQEVRLIPCWAPKDDRNGGEFDLDGESHRRFVLERLTEVASRAGVVAEEPEWEYGVRLHPGIEYKPNENRATYTPPTTPHPSLERAQEMAGLNLRYRATYHRRRKAGPWEPVEN